MVQDHGPDLWQYCEKFITAKFCQKINCGLFSRHGIILLFNAQQSFVECGAIYLWVINADNQEVKQKTQQKRCMKSFLDPRIQDAV